MSQKRPEKPLGTFLLHANLLSASGKRLPVKRLTIPGGCCYAGMGCFTSTPELLSRHLKKYFHSTIVGIFVYILSHVTNNEKAVPRAPGAAFSLMSYIIFAGGIKIYASNACPVGFGSTVGARRAVPVAFSGRFVNCPNESQPATHEASRTSFLSKPRSQIVPSGNLISPHLRPVEVAHGHGGHAQPVLPVLHQADAAGIGRDGRGVDPQLARHAGDDLLPPVAQAIGDARAPAPVHRPCRDYTC